MEKQQEHVQSEAVRAANLARHASQCSICLSPHKEEIEQEWLNWGNTAHLAEQYGLSRYAIYRHAHGVGLFSRRQKNYKRALEKIIERLDLTTISGSVVLGAIKEYAKLDAAEAAAEGTQVSGRNSEGATAVERERPESEPPEAESPSVQ